MVAMIAAFDSRMPAYLRDDDRPAIVEQPAVDRRVMA
jgi:hypothetical protein